MSTRVNPATSTLEAAFVDFHERNFMCAEEACDWGVIDTGEVDPDTFIPILIPCPACNGMGFLPRKAV